ncbi:MAG: glycosyltransferase [Patescibacteria group bacterium]
MFLSWIIPAYNEEQRIVKSIREVDAYLRSKQFPGGYEIVVCDSASRDRTADVVRGLQAEIPHLRLMTVENKGKGWAVRSAMLGVSGDIRIFSDADNSVSPEQFGNLLPFIRSPHTGGAYDVVIGSIEVPGAFIEEHAQWYRRMLGKLAKYLIRLGAGLWTICDSQRGFKLFTGSAAERIFPLQTILGWGFDFEVLLIAKKAGFSIKEVPVHWINPGGSRVGLAAYVSTFRDLLQVMKNNLAGRYRV